MKGSDYFPLGLLAVAGAFVAYQVATRSPATTPASAVMAPTHAAPVTPQGAARNNGSASSNPSAVSADSSALLPDSSTPITTPARDLETVRALIKDGAPGTYFESMLVDQDQLIMRWPERRLEPLRVWIERHPALPGWDVRHAVAAEAAFDEWQRAGFPLRFDIVRDSAGAEIHIRWIAAFPVDAREKLGMARKTRDQHGWIRAAEITVAMTDRAGEPLPDGTISGTVRHEIGHALGLGHSPNPGDVMFPESRTIVISAADRATLHLLYILPPGSMK